MASFEWLQKLSELTSRDEPCVLVTVMDAKGSTPREAGTKMIVTVNGQSGTIGGGNLEFQAAAEARKLLAQSSTSNTAGHYPLGPKLAQCCGGAVTVFLEPFIQRRKTVWLFGAGHVGREVVKVLDGIDARIKWIDSRAAEFPALIPANTEKIITDAPQDLVAQASDGDFIIVMTHAHETDYLIAKAALQKTGIAYTGVIGSDTKNVKFRKRLQADDVAAEKMTCPIGIDGIEGKHPREIAISVAAELLTLGLSLPAQNTDKENTECEGRDCATCAA